MESRHDDVSHLLELMHIFFKKMSSEMMDIQKQLGITGPQFHMLHLISQLHTCRITYLADLLQVKPSAITVMIERLVQNGLVSRNLDERDRRVVLVSITETGRQTLNRMLQQINQTAGKYFSMLEPEELESITAAFKKLIRYMDEEGDRHREINPSPD